MKIKDIITENLRDWFGKEKWVRFGPDGKIRGDCARGSSSEGKPKCLPAAKAHALGKKGRASAAAKKRREDPNPERRGPAKNVATRVKEGFEYGNQVQHPKYGAGQIIKVYSNGVITVNFPNYLDPIDKKPGVQSNFGPGDKDYQSLKPLVSEKQDACYRKVKSRYKVWPSAYASGALVQCRKKGAANWGNKKK